MPEEEAIWIVTADTPEIEIIEGARGGFNRGGNWDDDEVTRETIGSKGGAVKVSAQKLEEEMTQFLHVVERVFSRAEQQAKVNSGIQLNEIELSVEISGEGEVKLIGNGVKAGAKGAIKLTFRRK
ncbi:MAG: hypothetical protein ACHBN1_28335 [Heteroscytonema crispum UTEX LB 1556]